MDTIILIVLAIANGTAEEIAKKTGLKEKAVYHLLEFLTIAGIVRKQNDRYFVDETDREIAELMLALDDLDYDYEN